VGVSDPHQHVVMVKAAKASGLSGALGNGIATCLVARQPFTALDRVVLESELSRTGFEVVVAPFSGVDSEYGRILAGKDLERFYDTYPLDIRAPTDDKPFFFQMLRIQDFGRSLAENWLDPNRTNLQAIRVLVLLLGIVFVLTTLCVVVPLSIRSRGAGLRGSASFLLFFVAIGLGFMFVEISQMQRLMVFLGRPTYALSVVLFTLLVGSGVGSLICGRWLPNANPRRCMLALAGVVVALALFGVLTPLMIDALGAATTSARVSATAAILFGIGLFLGLPFPLGMHAAKRRAAELTPWLWGINGAASVLCSVLAMIVALSFGITTCFWVGVACYAVAVSAYTMLGKPVTL